MPTKLDWQEGRAEFGFLRLSMQHCSVMADNGSTVFLKVIQSKGSKPEYFVEARNRYGGCLFQSGPLAVKDQKTGWFMDDYYATQKEARAMIEKWWNEVGHAHSGTTY